MPRLTNGLEQVLTNLGIVGDGYKLFFYKTGTTTLKSTYSDEDLTIANTNPIVLNAAGRPDVDIWGSDPSLYRMILGTPDSVVGNITTIVDVDPVDNYQIDNIANLNPIPTAYWGTTAGSSTAYTLEEPLVNIASYSNTQTFFIDIHIACGASPTLKVKDLAAITFKKYKGDGTTTDLVESDLQIQRYLCINNGTNIVVLNPEKPFFSGENIFEATATKRGVSYLPSFIAIANNISDSNNDIDFTAGTFQFSDGSGQAVATAMTKRLDANWFAGTNQGGLDTGSKANSTWYYCYAIYNPTTLVSDFLFSASATSPTLPTGFTKFQRIKGFFKTNSSGNIIPFYLSSNGIWSIKTTTAADQLLATASSTGGATISNAFPVVANKAMVSLELTLTQAGYSSLTVWGNQQSTPSAATPPTAGLRGSSIGTNNSYSCAGIGQIFNDDGILSYRNIEFSGGVLTNRICYLSIEDLS